MNINFNGYDENVVTMLCSNTLTEEDKGTVVTIKPDGFVTRAASGDAILGTLVALRDGYCAVQTRGFIKASTDTKIPCGFKTIASDGKGGVIANTSGRQLFVIESTDDYAGILL